MAEIVENTKLENIKDIKNLRKEISRRTTKLAEMTANLTELISKTWDSGAKVENEQFSKTWELKDDEQVVTTTITIKSKIKKLEII